VSVMATPIVAVGAAEAAIVGVPAASSMIGRTAGNLALRYGNTWLGRALGLGGGAAGGTAINEIGKTTIANPQTSKLAEPLNGQIGRVFWSGGEPAKNAAMDFAKSNGMTTLEMTRAGQNLENLTRDVPWSIAKPMWERLSTAYAQGAVGPVHVFHNASKGVSLQSVWRTVEYPVVNGRNTIIYHNIFEP